jgi:hypothetical protein
VDRSWIQGTCPLCCRRRCCCVGVGRACGWFQDPNAVPEPPLAALPALPPALHRCCRGCRRIMEPAPLPLPWCVLVTAAAPPPAWPTGRPLPRVSRGVLCLPRSAKPRRAGAASGVRDIYVCAEWTWVTGFSRQRARSARDFFFGMGAWLRETRFPVGNFMSFRIARIREASCPSAVVPGTGR